MASNEKCQILKTSWFNFLKKKLFFIIFGLIIIIYKNLRYKIKNNILTKILQEKSTGISGILEDFCLPDQEGRNDPDPYDWLPDPW